MPLWVHCEQEKAGCTVQALNGSSQMAGWIVVQQPFPVDDEEAWGGIFCSPTCAIDYLQAHQPDERMLYDNGPDGSPTT